MAISTILWLNGTVGTGKSTIGASVAQHLAASGEAVAFVEIDALAAKWPRAAEDPFNTQLVAENLAAVTTNFAAAGARTLVVAGVIQSPGDLARYEEAVGLSATVVRLVVAPLEVERRLRLRHGELDPGGLRWHVARAPELDAILDASELSMAVVRNDGDLAGTVQAVLAAAGWEGSTR